jgi:hypothetical protein
VKLYKFCRRHGRRARAYLVSSSFCSSTMKLTFTTIIRDQWTKTPPVEKADLSGRTVIVVGANTGIGLDAVKHFAKMSPGRIIMACRSEVKGKAAIEGTYINLISGTVSSNDNFQP